MASETSPLLSEQETTNEPSDTPSTEGPKTRTRSQWPWLYVVAILLLLTFVADIAETLLVAPRIRFIEAIACYRYYKIHDPSVIGLHSHVPEELCKIDEIQSKVMSVMGGQLFFDSIPSILLPIPYSMLADSWGRKPVLTLGLIGCVLYMVVFMFLAGLSGLPLELSWLSALCLIIGGGPSVATTWLTTMVADVVPPQLRSTVFFYRFCCDQVSDLLMPPFTAALMAHGVWPPLLVVVALQVITVLLSLVLPETLPVPEDKGVSNPSEEDLNSNHEAQASNGKGISLLANMLESFASFMRDRTVMLLVFTFLISRLGRQTNAVVLLQYASKKYGWSLSKAGLLVSIRAAVNIVLFVIILPVIVNFLLPGRSAAAKDFLVGKISILLLTLGAFIMFNESSVPWLIIGLVVSTLGAGFPPVMRSLTTSLVELQNDGHASDIGRLYALIGIMEGIGNLVAGPGLAWAFNLGMSWGKAWLGLPYALATALFACICVIVFSVRINT